MVITQPYTQKMELKKSRDYGSMVSHNANFYSFIPVIHSNLFQNIPFAQKQIYKYFSNIKIYNNKILYKNKYFWNINNFIDPKKYSSPGNNLSNLEQNKK
jgi:hypothetical protein